MKKTFSLLIAVIGVILLGFLGWFYLINDGQPIDVTQYPVDSDVPMSEAVCLANSSLNEWLEIRIYNKNGTETQLFECQCKHLIYGPMAYIPEGEYKTCP